MQAGHHEAARGFFFWSASYKASAFHEPDDREEVLEARDTRLVASTAVARAGLTVGEFVSEISPQSQNDWSSMSIMFVLQ